MIFCKVKLDEGTMLPTRAHDTDAGYDLYAREDFKVPHAKVFGYRAEIGCAVHDTGVHIEIPKGYVGFLKSKSGLNVRYGLTSEGVIDSGYTGSIVVKLYNHTSKPYKVKKGDKISQLVILPIATPQLKIVDSLEDTERGTGGFGSTGK
jgi:dUTP pyrophosphatase